VTALDFDAATLAPRLVLKHWRPRLIGDDVMTTLLLDETGCHLPRLARRFHAASRMLTHSRQSWLSTVTLLRLM
jgi:hypothetical protein